MKKVYSYDNFEGDKGTIIADSLEEAKTIYHQEYPERQISDTSEEYHNGGCFLEEVDTFHGESKLFITFPW